MRRRDAEIRLHIAWTAKSRFRASSSLSSRSSTVVLGGASTGTMKDSSTKKTAGYVCYWQGDVPGGLAWTVTSLADRKRRRPTSQTEHQWKRPTTLPAAARNPVGTSQTRVQYTSIVVITVQETRDDNSAYVSPAGMNAHRPLTSTDASALSRISFSHFFRFLFALTVGASFNSTTQQVCILIRTLAVQLDMGRVHPWVGSGRVQIFLT